MIEDKNVFVLDTETTDASPEARAIQVGYIHAISPDNLDSEILHVQGICDEFADPGVPISYDAMAVHHIEQDMVKGKPRAIANPEIMDRLNEHNNKDSYFVAHNARFDLTVMRNEGFKNNMKIIDTMICAKHLIPDITYGLGSLIHRYGLYKECLEYIKVIQTKGILPAGKVIASHDSITDCFYCLFFLEKILIGQLGYSLEELAKITLTPFEVEYFPFGKYSKDKWKGSAPQPTVDEVAGRIDPGYVKWALENLDAGRLGSFLEQLTHVAAKCRIVYNRPKELGLFVALTDI